MSAALVEHDRILIESIRLSGGEVFKTVGDGVYATFEDPGAGIRAALLIQQRIKAVTWPTSRPIKVRMALHTGLAEVRDGDYFGNTLNRLARLLSTGYGGQVLLSHTTTALASSALPEGAELRYMGEHLLKDLDAPERIAQLCHPDLESEFPPLKSLNARPNNLPRLLSTFVGRVKERSEVHRLLEGGPLVTFVGAGGTGKTRLAIEVGSESLERFPGGVWLVEFGPLRDPALLTQAIAAVIGVREEAQRPLIQSVIAALSAKQCLLILDNCEHVLRPAADLVNQLLRTCKGLSLLVTSREPLRIGGEQVYRVPSLVAGSAAVKTVAEASQLDAVRLLVDRAKQNNPAFELTDAEVPAAIQICRQLDGIPFAIELAASRLKVLSLAKIADRLRDRFKLLTTGQEASIPRQQTLRATIEWSYDLLEPAERTLLGRLAIFVGGWQIEAAESVCASEDLEDWEVLDGLMRLVDKSLVVRDTDSDETRFSLLETVRQFALETLAEEELAQVRRRHAEYFANFASEAEDGIQGPEQRLWLRRVDDEHENLRAVFAAAGEGAPILEAGLKIVGAIGRFWTVRGYYSEGRQWIESLLAIPPPTADALRANALRANALRTAGQLAYWQGDSQAGRKFAQESLEICQQLGDRDGEARSLFRLGFACLSEHDLTAARAAFEAGLSLAESIGDQNGIPHLENALGEVAELEGNFAEAQRRFQASLAGFRLHDDLRSVASVLKNLASLATMEHRFTDAEALLLESLRLREGLGNPTGIAVTLDCFGLLASARNDHELATYWLAAAHTIHSQRGSQPEPSEGTRISEAKERADDALGRSEFDRVWERGCTDPLETVLERLRESSRPNFAVIDAAAQKQETFNL